MWTFCIYILGIRSYDVSHYVTGKFQYAVIRIESVLKVVRCIVIFVCISKVTFLKFYDMLEERVAEIELYLRVICIKVCHYLLFCL